MADAVIVMALASRDAANPKELSTGGRGLICGKNGTNDEAACLNMGDKRWRIQLKLLP
jgi:hypothetical protein